MRTTVFTELVHPCFLLPSIHFLLLHFVSLAGHKVGQSSSKMSVVQSGSQVSLIRACSVLPTSRHALFALYQKRIHTGITLSWQRHVHALTARKIGIRLRNRCSF